MNLLIGILLSLLGQTLIWFQTNGQFVWEWFRKNPIILSVAFGGIISYLFILGTKYLALHFDGLLWPVRFIGFGSGMVVFSILTWYFMGEGISAKTIISLILSFSLVAIQIFWK
jgi:hypothetical protein